MNIFIVQPISSWHHDLEVKINLPFFLCLWLDSSIEEDGGQKGDIEMMDFQRPFVILLLQFVELSLD